MTVEEHAEAHRLLYEEYGKWQDWVAWQGLTKNIGNNDVIQIATRIGGRIGGLKTKGIPKTEKHKQSLRIARKNQVIVHSDETKRRISAALLGRRLTETHKLAISEGKKKHTSAQKQ